jgi:uncharacterized phage protein gp47/JayE
VAIVDGTVTWRFLGGGEGAVDVIAVSSNTGPIIAVSGDIVTIETPVAGWNGVVNLLDADLGNNEEQDEDLRYRRTNELAGAGTRTEEAIETAVLNIPGVTAVKVFVNDQDTPDADGVPGHSVEVLVLGGDDQAIFDVLRTIVAEGIYTHGNEVGTSTDSQGNVHTIRFSRPTTSDIYIEVTLLKDPRTYAATGDALVADAIVSWGDAQPAGKDVVSSAIKAQCFKVAGVLDVTLAYIGTAPGPISETTLNINVRELALYDTSRITVNSSNATP